MLSPLTLHTHKNLNLPSGSPLSPLTALIGPNGCGKSNLVGTLRFLQQALLNPDSLENEMDGFVQGGVDLGEMKTLNARIQPPGRGSLGYEFAPDSQFFAGLRYQLDRDVST
jgi:energy-coupling factor transporter ATP-binding protein EcfA2